VVNRLTGPVIRRMFADWGSGFAVASNMARPGKTPEITTERDTITFVMRVALDQGHSARLVIRCQRDGEIVVSLRSADKTAARPTD
jgi:hypothetical protein